MHGRKTPHQARRAHLKRHYKMTLEDYDAMLDEQGGVCAICRTLPGQRRLAVDHDHNCCSGHERTCGHCIRGLLCANCNSILGRWRDDPDVMATAIAYLAKGPRNR
jgi:hypothetical protein